MAEQDRMFEELFRKDRPARVTDEQRLEQFREMRQVIERVMSSSGDLGLSLASLGAAARRSNESFMRFLDEYRANVPDEFITFSRRSVPTRDGVWHAPQSLSDARWDDVRNGAAFLNSGRLEFLPSVSETVKWQWYRVVESVFARYEHNHPSTREPMARNVHPICSLCWSQAFRRPLVAVLSAQMAVFEPCCICSENAPSGIYVLTEGEYPRCGEAHERSRLGGGDPTW